MGTPLRVPSRDSRCKAAEVCRRTNTRGCSSQHSLEGFLEAEVGSRPGGAAGRCGGG